MLNFGHSRFALHRTVPIPHDYLGGSIDFHVLYGEAMSITSRVKPNYVPFRATN